MKTILTGAMPGASHLTISCALVLVVLLSGCGQYGPEAMRASRLAYNEAVQVSEQREILLNLVRLRYTDAPEFLEISGISTQMNFAAGASIGGEFGEVEESNSAFVSPGASVGYSESPTITFLPRRDKEFTRQLVAPVELDSVHLLTNYGWGLDRVLVLIASEINGISNASTRESASFSANDGEDFEKIIEAVHQLGAERLIRVGIQRRKEAVSAYIPVESVSVEDHLAAAKQGYRLEPKDNLNGYVMMEEKTHYVLFVDPQAWKRPEFNQLSSLLEIRSGLKFYEIDGTGHRNQISLQLATRSVLGIMAYLSKTVEIPTGHEGLVGANVAAPPALRQKMRINAATTPPAGMALAVQYRDHWFYIRDDDLESKRTLGLLTSLIRLNISAGGAQNIPILTLPVSP